MSIFSIYKKIFIFSIFSIVLGLTEALYAFGGSRLLDIERSRKNLEEKIREGERCSEAYVAEEIAQGKTYEDLIQLIKNNENNTGVQALLVMSLMYKFGKDLNDIRLDLSRCSRDDMNGKVYEQEVKPFLCDCLFGKKTDEQILQEIKQAPTEVMRSVIFGKAKHCGRIQEDYESYCKKHNIQWK